MIYFSSVAWRNALDGCVIFSLLVTLACPENEESVVVSGVSIRKPQKAPYHECENHGPKQAAEGHQGPIVPPDRTVRFSYRYCGLIIN